jgi:uncharacterized membrane protein YkvA (DUF1232 family)
MTNKINTKDKWLLMIYFPPLFALYKKTIKIKRMTKKSIINYQSLWEKISDCTKSAGRISARPVLLLYYVLKSPETPMQDKVLIISALSYLVLPIDLLSAKRIPVIGWIDEIASIAYAYQKVRKHITPEIETEVDNVLERWFPETEYDLIVG